MKRAESQARTRERLLIEAANLFRSDGYSGTSIDRIAEAAGFSKGAFYSNFANKEAVLLAVLELGKGGFEQLVANIETAKDATEIVDLLAGWADDRSRNGNWILAILDHARIADPNAASVREQEQILRANWKKLGGVLLARFPDIASAPETLGALLYEIAYAPAMTLIEEPTAGQLMRLAVAPLLGGQQAGQTGLRS